MVLLELSQVSDTAIVIDTVLEKDGAICETINGHFFLFLTRILLISFFTL